MGRIMVQVQLANNDEVVLARGDTTRSVERLEVEGVVDTGASRLVLPAAVVNRLRLAANGQSHVRYADGLREVREMVRSVWLRLEGREGVFSAVVEPGRETVLVGAIVLEELDLLADWGAQTVWPRDPDRIVSELE